MYTKLSLQEKLKDERVNRHMTLLDLEKATGIGHATLSKYESDNCTDISPFNLAKLAEFYGLSMDYLMGLTENKCHPNTPLYELHLNDSMVKLLKSGRINNRLLCELACHPGFVRLMTDIEVCVDRIADMHIRDMNLLLEQSRQAVISKYHPDDDDINLRTLELAQVSEDLFYSHVIHDDLDAIVKDLRKQHEKDPTTAEAETEAETIAQDMALLLAEALNYEGTADEKRGFLICQVLDIDFDKLTQEDRSAFVRVCKKSPKLKNIISQRGKSSPIPPENKKRKKR